MKKLIPFLFILFSCACRKDISTTPLPKEEKRVVLTDSLPKISIQLLLTLKGGPGNTADGCVVVFDPSFSQGIGNEDSYKFLNFRENIYFTNKGNKLSIEGKPFVNGFDTSRVEITNYQKSFYYVRFVATNYPSNYYVVIKDNYTKRIYLLDSILTIRFNSVSTIINRFLIVYKKK